MRPAALKSVAVGFFDGVHLGHRAILEGVDEALTFRNHPLTVIAPEKAPRLIMSAEERADSLRSFGIREVTMLDFTANLAALTPEEFMRRYLAGKVVHCGANWRFGHGGTGDADWLRRQGCEVRVAPDAEFKGRTVSSSRIRAALGRGELDDVRAMLGRAYSLEGRVASGKGLGAGLGFPTVNLRVADEATRQYPPRGVYSAECAGKRVIANFGLAPTMGERAWKSPVLEVHFIGDDVPLMEEGSRWRVLLHRFIRPERRFASVGALKRQIADDLANML